MCTLGPGAEAAHTLEPDLFSALTFCVCVILSMNLNHGRYPNKWRFEPLSYKRRKYCGGVDTIPVIFLDSQLTH